MFAPPGGTHVCPSRAGWFSARRGKDVCPSRGRCRSREVDPQASIPTDALHQTALAQISQSGLDRPGGQPRHAGQVRDAQKGLSAAVAARGQEDGHEDLPRDGGPRSS